MSKYISRLAEKQIRMAFEQSEKEVTDLRQRTSEGLRTARLAGKQVGQVKGKAFIIKKEKPIKDIILAKSKSFHGSNSDNEVISIINGSKAILDEKRGEQPLHISRKTYYVYKRELTDDMR